MLIQASDLERFSLSVVDGPIGRIHDLQVDDQGWGVSDIVASVGHWLTERLIIVRPTSVVKVDRSHQSIEVALTPDEIAGAAGPMSHPSVSRQHQVAAYHYLGLPLMVDLVVPAPGKRTPSALASADRVTLGGASFAVVSGPTMLGAEGGLALATLRRICRCAEYWRILPSASTTSAVQVVGTV